MFVLPQPLDFSIYFLKNKIELLDRTIGYLCHPRWLGRNRSSSTVGILFDFCD